MLIPNDFLECVCFLCVKETRGGADYFDYGGTAFIVSVPSETQPKEHCYAYLVTAKHCIQDRSGVRRNLYVRLNKEDGTAEHLALPDNWLVPDDEAVDVALMPFEPDSPPFAYKHIPMVSAATDESIRWHYIGIGNDVFVSGLFTQRIGKQRNQPIIRAGIISSMRGELEDESSGQSYDAYLIELQSISGLSGSPVFALSRSQPVFLEKGPYSLLLLGLIRGHFDTTRRKEQRTDEPVRFSDDEWDRIHNGIAIVTPVQEILKLLEREELVKHRKEKDKELKQSLGHSQTLDSGFSESQPESSANELTKEGFEVALKKVFPRPSESDSESDET